MPRFHFDIHENGNLILDENGQDFVNVEGARKEAVLTGASIARDAVHGQQIKNTDGHVLAPIGQA